MVMTGNKNANYDPLLLHQAHDAATEADQQKDSQSYKNNDDSLYVDPLDIIEPDRTSTASDAQKAIQDAHERLMNKTGGQPVEEDLGGWLLVITILLIILLIISVIPALAWLLSALSGNVTVATSVIPNTIIALTTGMFIQNIFQRRNPLRLLAIICTVLITYGVVELGLFFLDGLSTSNHLRCCRVGTILSGRAIYIYLDGARYHTNQWSNYSINVSLYRHLGHRQGHFSYCSVRVFFD